MRYSIPATNVASSICPSAHSAATHFTHPGTAASPVFSAPWMIPSSTRNLIPMRNTSSPPSWPDHQRALVLIQSGMSMLSPSSQPSPKPVIRMSPLSRASTTNATCQLPHSSTLWIISFCWPFTNTANLSLSSNTGNSKFA